MGMGGIIEVNIRGTVSIAGRRARGHAREWAGRVCNFGNRIGPLGLACLLLVTGFGPVRRKNKPATGDWMDWTVLYSIIRVSGALNFIVFTSGFPRI